MDFSKLRSESDLKPFSKIRAFCGELNVKMFRYVQDQFVTPEISINCAIRGEF